MQASTATRLAPYQQHGPLPVLLVGLTVVTRVVDAVSYIALGHVFVANMTEAKRKGASVLPRGRGGPHGRTLATGAGLDPTLERYGLLVGELGLLLETVHGPPRWRRVRAVVEHWRHDVRRDEASQGASARAGSGVMTFGRAAEPARPPERRSTSRLLHERPDAWRIERRRGRGRRRARRRRARLDVVATTASRSTEPRVARPHGGYDPRDERWRAVIREGVEPAVLDGRGPSAGIDDFVAVRFDRGETHLEIQAHHLDADRVVELALALRPAPTEPPPLGPPRAPRG